MFKLDMYMQKWIEKIKKLLGLSRKTGGFTLIELLVVIGILGVLAAALVATIDPFEQLKKADDSKIKNISVEFQTALVRYYTTHGSFPWNDQTSITNNTNNNCTGLSSGPIAGVKLNVATVKACLDNAGGGSLISEGELKASFTSNLNDLAKVYVSWNPASATNVIVCFSPTSKSQKAAPDTKWINSQGSTTGAACPSATAADNTCFWCTQ
jgi:prepilin-type N-terminal cleavage/methylation domain-containing protein